MATDPILIETARRQLATVLAATDTDAFLGWWLAWSSQAGVEHDDLIDLIKDPQLLALIGGRDDVLG